MAYIRRNLLRRVSQAIVGEAVLLRGQEVAGPVPWQSGAALVQRAADASGREEGGLAAWGDGWRSTASSSSRCCYVENGGSSWWRGYRMASTEAASLSSAAEIASISSLSPPDNTSLSASTLASPSSESSISLSDSAVQRLKQLREEEGRDVMLRLSVEGGGCSGFQYRFQLDSNRNDDDRVFVRDGAHLVVDEVSLEFVRGATVDFSEELIRSAFQVIGNPNSASSCGCGASFMAK